jgi:hypothetical protein
MVCPTFTKSKYFRFFAVVVLISIVAGVSYGLYLFNLKHSDLSKKKPDFTLNSTELYTAFESDETTATAKYTGKIVELSGNVAQVEFGSTDSTLSITLRPDDQFSGVICTFGGIKDLSQVQVNTGEQITVRGECSGMLMDVLLNNCVIIKKD